MEDAYTQRLRDLDRFYRILGQLERRLGGRRQLGACDGRMDWPQRGVYFFLEHGEVRKESGEDSRVVRVGTHALKKNAQSTLWKRLSQHRGRNRNWRGGGSVFRNHIGRALMTCDGNPPSGRWRERMPGKEHDFEIEKRISAVTREMHFLWLAVEDEPGPNSERGYIERNAIALLSNYGKADVDSPSVRWLGRHTKDDKICNSGLWNVNHVDEHYEENFFDRFQSLVNGMKVS